MKNKYNLPLFFARKYFFSGKISGVVHIIAGISLLGITFGSFALIAILSGFNGFEEIINKMYNTLDSDIKIYATEGKYFTIPTETLNLIYKNQKIKAITPVIEENALMKYRDKQSIATIKAIDPSYLKSMGLDTLVISGKSTLKFQGLPVALFGAGVASKLNVAGEDMEFGVQIYLPKKGPINLLNPENAFNKKYINPAGVFSALEEFDAKYVLVPIDFGRSITEQETGVTAFEINLKDENDMQVVKQDIISKLGESYKVLDKYQQQSTLYKVMKFEKLAVYLVLSFVIAIAAFNLIGSLLMLALEKRKDMMTLISLGANSSLIKKIILFEGLLISFTGGVLGIISGFIVCLLQQKFGFLKISENSTFVYNSYPIAFNPIDFIVVFVTVMFIGFLASYFPSRFAFRNLNVKDLK